MTLLFILIAFLCGVYFSGNVKDTLKRLIHHKQNKLYDELIKFGYLPEEVECIIKTKKGPA